MCILITATLPLNVDRSLLKDLLDRYNLAFEPIQNEFIQKQLGKDDIYLKATKWGCDCNTGLGSWEILNTVPTSDQLKTFRKSRAKKFLKEIKNRNKQLRVDANKWMNFINELLGKENVHKLGLLIHFYKSGLGEEGEEFNIKRIDQIALSNSTCDYLTKIEEDVLYEFIKS